MSERSTDRPLIEISDLSIDYETDDGPLRAVDSLDLSIDNNEILGIVGESGCGKTTLGKSLIGLLPKNGQVSGGSIECGDYTITGMNESELKRTIRWKNISYIPQNAMNAFDPVYRVGKQIVEVIRTHTDLSKKEARDRVTGLFEDVSIDPQRMHNYPHELSGGQKQRAAIASALAVNPKLIIADEATTGLDVAVQSGILDLLADIKEEHGVAIIFISHDINVIREISDRVGVMYGGQLVEIGKTSEVLERGGHPYTMGLRRAFPTLERGVTVDDMVSIPGTPPNLLDDRPPCRFIDRCPFATDECQFAPLMERVSTESHHARCHFVQQSDEFREQSKDPAVWGEVK